MWRRISAIAKDTVRKQARSGTVACTGVFLMLSVAAVSLSIQGDGVLAGELSVMIRYSLAVALLVLAVVTLWVSCGAVSREVADRRIHVVATKPVRKIEIWLGKWVGIMALNSIALAAAFLLVYAVVSVRMASETNGGQIRRARTKVVTARRAFAPINTDFTRKAREKLEELRRNEDIPSDVTDREIVAEVKRQMVFRHYTVSRGQSRKWIFRVPVAFLRRQSEYCSLDFKFRTPGLERLEASGIWRVTCGSHTNSFSREIMDYLGGRYSFDIPMDVFRPAAENIQDRHMEIEALYLNAGGKDASTVMFDPDGGVTLMVKAGTFEINLFRSFVVGFCQLGMIAAAGLTAGVCFSFPVAAFVSSCVAVVALLADYFRSSAAQYVRHHHGESAEPGFMEKAMESFAEGLSMIFEPLAGFDVLARLSNGRIVSWELTFQAILLMGLVVPLLLACLAAVVFSAKEFK